jgi:DNA-binding MarR family transcriptional regulator
MTDRSGASGETIERLADALVSLQRALLRSVRAFVAQQGVEPRLVPILLYVYQHPGATVSEIARGMQESKGNLSPLIERLATAGWLVKQRDPSDRRLLRVHLSEASRTRATTLRRAYHQHLESLFVGLSPERAEAALALFAELEGRLAAAAPAADPVGFPPTTI